MKVRKVTITSTQLNSGNYIETDLTYTGSDNKEYFPIAAQYVNPNNSLVSIGFVSLENDNEKLEAIQNPLYYEYLVLPFGNSVGDLPPTKYFRVKLLSGSALYDLIIYFYCYEQRVTQ